MSRKIEISHRTIIFTVLFLILVWVLFQIRPIIVSLFIAFLLMSALTPLVDLMVKVKIPRGLAIIVVYLGLLALLIGGLGSLVSPLVDQTQRLAKELPNLFDQFGGWLGSLGISGVDGDLIAGQVSQIGSIPANLVTFIIFLFSNLIIVISVLVITFYMLLERKNLDQHLMLLFGGDGEQRAKVLIDKIEARLGGWVRGELVLMLIIGVMTYIGLLLLNVPYALPLAILAGILEIVPTIGPVISGIPAVIAALTISPLIGLATTALYFLIQQLENSIIVPKVMQKAIGVNPLVTIVALGIGFQLAGPLGAILSVPVFIVFQQTAIEFLDLNFFKKKK